MSSLSPLDSSPAAAAAEVPLAPGFRFHPTDEELVSYYLRRRIAGRRLRVDAIAEVDLYRLEPWELPSLSRIRSRDAQWYFFARLDRKITGAGAGGRGGPGNRTNRATPQGYWKTTGKDREVYHRGKAVGMKKTLVFHNGRAPKGARTNWVMHEYRLIDADGPQDLHVVCRIFQKFGSGPQNGAQYGAPYMEEEWEEEDAAIENGAANGASVKAAATSDTADEESNEEDDNGYSKTNELAQAHEVLNPPEVVPLQAQGSNETSDGSYDDGAISLEEILSSTVSAENIGRPEGQNASDQSFNVADFSGCPTKDDGYIAQDSTMNWSDPANDVCANWPLRAYSNQNPVRGTLGADEMFDTGNGSNENSYSGQQQICQSDYQNLNLQADEFVAPRQVDGGMVFYDPPPSWEDGNVDLYLSDFLNDPLENQSLFEGEDIMDFFVDAPENDFQYNMLGSTEGSDNQLTEISYFAQKECPGTVRHISCPKGYVPVYPLHGVTSLQGDDKDKSTFDEISKTPAANGHSGASSSGSHGNMYPDTAVPVDGTLDKACGRKRLVDLLGSIPAPPAFASEDPPITGKSVLAGVSPSSIRVTAGIIQLGGLNFTGSERMPLQKNGDFNLLLSFTMESDVTPKSVSFEPATRVGAIPMVMRSGLYLFFVSAMILMLSYKIGSCIYSR